jgi:hypothetical protein
MKEIIDFEDWIKFDLRFGEIKTVKNGLAKISLGNKEYSVKTSLNLQKGDKIVVGIQGGKLIILHVNNSVIIPEKEIENGSRIG